MMRFRDYIEGASAVIHQTDNIQKLRALASQIRYRTTDDGIRAQVDAVRSDNRLTDEEIETQIREIYEHGKFTLSNFVNELDEYTNLLANKKSKYDRTVEAMFNRKVYGFLKKFNSRVAGNMIVGNISSYLTNFIPLTQAAGQLDSRSLLKGMWATLRAYKSDDGMVARSTFLTNRRGSDTLIKTLGERVGNTLSTPMEAIDSFTSGSIVRAAYIQYLKRGLSEEEAMYQADIFAASVIADRSKGAMPTIFAAQNPLFKMFTQFQLEVNNQFSEMFKDLPRTMKDRGVKALAWALFKYFIGAFLFNEVFEFFSGRRPAIDPLSIINEFVGDATGYELPNLLRYALGEDDFKTERVGFGQAVKNLGSKAAGQLPFSAGLTLLGMETDGGRVPASAAVPNLGKLWDAATNEQWDSRKRWDEAADELGKLAYVAPPFLGNAGQKLWKSARAYIEGGSYSVDSEGNDILQYPVYRDDTSDAVANAIRMMIFGKSSTPEAQAWVESGFESLNAKQTAAYRDMIDAGVNDRDAYELMMEIRSAEESDSLSKKAAQKRIVFDSDISGEGKAIAFYTLLASDKNRSLMDKLDDIGADPGAVVETIIAIDDTGSLPGAAEGCAKRDIIAEASLSDEEKIMIYVDKVSASRASDIDVCMDAGIDFNTFLDAHNRYAQIDEEYSGATEKATQFSRWINSLDLDDDQKDVLRDCFRYYSMVPAKAGGYDNLMDAGLEDKQAFDLYQRIDQLEPDPGASRVSNLQKWNAVMEEDLTEDQQLSVLKLYMSESEYNRLHAAHEMGLSPQVYVDYKNTLPEFDANDNGTYTQAETEAAVSAMPGLTREQKAILWQLGGKDWKAKNNPFDVDVGQEIFDILNGDDPETLEQAIMNQWKL